MPVNKNFKLPWWLNRCLTVWRTEFQISFRTYARVECMFLLKVVNSSGYEEVGQGVKCKGASSFSFRQYARAEGLQCILTVLAFWQIVARACYRMELAQKGPCIRHGIMDCQTLGGLFTHKHDLNFVQVIAHLFCKEIDEDLNCLYQFGPSAFQRPMCVIA